MWRNPCEEHWRNRYSTSLKENVEGQGRGTNRVHGKNVLSQRTITNKLDDEHESQQSYRAVIETLDGRSDTNIVFNVNDAKIFYITQVLNRKMYKVMKSKQEEEACHAR